jgi:glycosyltransferase involved in cell wall biosynthesis
MTEQSRDKTLRIGFFGTLYPESQYAGNSSSGMVALLSQADRVQNVRVYSQIGSQLPQGTDSTKVSLQCCWRHDDPISVLKTMTMMLRDRHTMDVMLFNTYVTALGKSRAANAFGILLPVSMAVFGRVPVVTYMHNFAETQDVSGLGYDPSWLETTTVRILEKLLVHTTQTVVPLESQRNKVSEILGGRVRALLLPYIDAVASLHSQPSVRELPYWKDPGCVRVLLFGHWGPQKDLEGALYQLLRMQTSGLPIEVVVAGAMNERFQEYFAKIVKLEKSLPPKSFHFIGRVAEEEVLSLIHSADLYLLPYNAEGGYSGAMNCAAIVGTHIVSYDLPQLREAATELGIDVVFISKGDDVALEKEVRGYMSKGERKSDEVVVPLSRVLGRAKAGVDRLIDFLYDSWS